MFDAWRRQHLTRPCRGGPAPRPELHTAPRGAQSEEPSPSYGSFVGQVKIEAQSSARPGSAANPLRLRYLLRRSAVSRSLLANGLLRYSGARLSIRRQTWRSADEQVWLRPVEALEDFGVITHQNVRAGT